MAESLTTQFHSIEDLYDMADNLLKSERFDGDGVTLFRGYDVLLGPVTLVIPPTGNGFLLLPVAPLK